MTGDLTLANQQREFFFGVLDEEFPDLADRYRQRYPEGSYGPARSNWKLFAPRLKTLCAEYGIRDRLPRPVIPGDKRTLNERIVEALANRLYYMELNNEPSRRVWAYRKAAWAIEDTPQDVGLIYQAMGRKGLESIDNVGPKMAAGGGAADRAFARNDLGLARDNGEAGAMHTYTKLDVKSSAWGVN